MLPVSRGLGQQVLTGHLTINIIVFIIHVHTYYRNVYITYIYPNYLTVITIIVSITILELWKRNRNS